MNVLAANGMGDRHAAFRAWLTAAVPGAPSVDLARHAAGCDACRSAVTAIDSLSAVHAQHPDLPAVSARVRREAPAWTWARYAIPAIVIVILAVARPNIGSVVAPPGEGPLAAMGRAGQGILGDWWTNPDQPAGGDADDGSVPGTDPGGGSPQPSLAPGAVPTTGATPPGTATAPSSGPIATAPGTPATTPPGAPPASDAPSSQPPASEPAVPPLPTPQPPLPTPQPPLPTPEPPLPTPEPPLPTPSAEETPGGPLPECANLIDDDRDGLVDLFDPGCVNGLDLTED